MTSAFFLLLLFATQASDHRLPRVFLLDANQLAQEGRMAQSRPDQPDAFLKAAIAQADQALAAGPFSVTQKTIAPPSGDKHDYMSWAPYFWPNPNTPNHLPYIRRDGEHNPEIKQIPDHDNMGKMCSTVRTLALAYYLTGHEEYAARAALLLRTWFTDPATKMNPNLEFAQGIRGVNTGRGSGLIESRVLTQVVDAVGLLDGSKNWTARDHQALEQWFTQFLAWMRTSQHGQEESLAKNNHGSYYDEQIADFALFVGKRDIAEEVLKNVPQRRIATQIQPDGTQPLELARTNSWGYSNFNLRALTELAILGNQVGVDLWHFESPDGRSMRKALDYLLPYATGAKPWPYKQISEMRGSDLAEPLLEAAKAFHNPDYEAAAKKLSAATDQHNSGLPVPAAFVLVGKPRPLGNWRAPAGFASEAPHSSSFKPGAKLRTIIVRDSTGAPAGLSQNVTYRVSLGESLCGGSGGCFRDDNVGAEVEPTTQIFALALRRNLFSAHERGKNPLTDVTFPEQS